MPSERSERGVDPPTCSSNAARRVVGLPGAAAARAPARATTRRRPEFFVGRVWGGRQRPPASYPLTRSDPRQESCSLCFCRCTPHHARWLLTYLRRWSAAKEGTLHASRDAPNCSRDGHHQGHHTDNGARSRVARSRRRILVGPPLVANERRHSVKVCPGPLPRRPHASLTRRDARTLRNPTRAAPSCSPDPRN